MEAERRLKEMGFEIPDLEKLYSDNFSGARFVSHRQVGDLLFVSGAVPEIDGRPFNPGVLGRDLTIEQGYEAARIAGLNALAQIKYAIGDLDLIEQFVQMTGYIASTYEFTDQPRVLNGASDLFVQVFGERGRHTRAAIGVMAMAAGSSVEVVVTVQVRGQSRRAMPTASSI